MNIKENYPLNIALLALVLFGLSGCSASMKYRKAVTNYYMPIGWIKYDESSQWKRSGLKLIEQAQAIDKGLTDVFAIHGKPDFVRAASKSRLNLAYLNKGQILTFKLRSGLAPNIYPYQKFNQLSQRMVIAFRDTEKTLSPVHE
jgi:hypothetical protein